MFPTSDARLTRSETLRQQVAMLGSVETSDAPFVSCFFNLDLGASVCRRLFDRQVRRQRANLSGEALVDFERALELVEAELARPRHPQARGLAVFARGPWGGRFATSLQFAVPLRPEVTVYPAPDVYPLMEVLDTYEPYLLVLLQPQASRVVEVDLGAVRDRAWLPHRRARQGAADACIADVDAEIELMPALRDHAGWLARVLGGNRRGLFLAGDLRRIEALQAQLPPAIGKRVLQTLRLPASAQLDHAVAISLSAFVEIEEAESQSIAAQVSRRAEASGQAVTGGLASLRALRDQRADMLVMNSAYRPETTWLCTRCGAGSAGNGMRFGCEHCCSESLVNLDLRLELARLAAQQGVPVEIVEDGEDLARRGSVGCLLKQPGQAPSVKLTNQRPPLGLAA